VRVPRVVPSRKIVTPGRYSPVASSNTEPLIVPFWAYDKDVIETKMTATNILKICMFLYVVSEISFRIKIVFVNLRDFFVELRVSK
jgi:hypothetical protein